jgi:acyl-CoA synthetase (AMP-forming)/AMP-acid ligase II
MWLDSILDRHAVRRPDSPALRDVRRSVSWRDLREETAALASALRERTPRGAAVAVLSGNCVEVVETYLACAIAGVVAVPVNPNLTDAEIAYILDAVGPVLAVADAAGRERLAAGYPHLATLAIEKVSELPAPAGPSAAPADLGAPVLILHTSATTGRPKGVVVDQRSLKANAYSWSQDVAPAPGTVFLNAGPLFHGSVVIALDYLAAGATVCVLDRFTPQSFIAAVETWRVEQAFLVPSMVQLLLDARGLADADLGSLRLLLHGAAPMPARLADQVQERLGVRLHTVYGITEGGGPAISLGPDDKPAAPPLPGATCAGRPMAGVALRITDEEGITLPSGELGEIRLCGDGLMHGYLNNPAATAAVLADGWLNTLDIGLRDDDGYVWIVDRRNDLILRGGQNVYPAEIEEALRRSPRVADVAVVPAPSTTWGQTPVAFVVPDGAGGEVTEAELIAELAALCVELLASYKRPSRFVPIDAIPRNPSGKVLRTVLRERAEQPHAAGRSAAATPKGAEQR